MKQSTLTYILTLSFLFLITTTYAQEFGVRAGYNSSTINFNEVDFGNTSVHHLPGFHVGLNLGIEITENLSLETLFFFNKKGSQTKFVDENGLESITATNLYYIDLPVGLKYKIPAGNINLFAIGGGYVGAGLFGNYKYKDDDNVLIDPQINIARNDDTIRFGGENSLRQLDAGLMYGAGVEYELFSLSVQHLSGLRNLSQSFKSKHQVFQVSLGYTFKNQAF